MIELLAIPAWQAAPTTLAAWTNRLDERGGGPVTVERDPPDGAWIVLGVLRIRGYAILAGPNVEAINFELAAPDPSAAARFLEEAATSLDWEIHPDDSDDGDDEDQDDNDD